MEAEIKNRIEQIRQGKVPAEYQKTPAGILPKSWKVTSLCNVLKKKNAKNKGRKYDRILTNSATKGIVPQTDYFDKQIANDENTEGYYVVEKGDFVYNPRISVSAPCGPFNKYYENETGIMSPLYSVYQFVDENVHYSEFLAQYFLSAYWYRYMNGIANYGARSDRMNVTQDMMDLMPLPYPPESEYKKIVRILLNQDRVIALREKLLAEKLRQKQYLMQVLLTGKKRLPGFTGKWNYVQMKTLGTTYSGLSGKNKEDFGKGRPYIPYINIYSNAVIDTNNFDYVSIAENEKQNSVKYGDIFFTTSSETPDEVGMSSVLLEKVDNLYLNSFCFGFRLHNFLTLLPQYAVYYFRGGNFRRILDSLAQGSTRFNLSKNNLLKAMLLLPPIKEQKAIVEILRTIDQEINLLKQELEQERRKKKALMQLLLSGIVRVQ